MYRLLMRLSYVTYVLRIVIILLVVTCKLFTSLQLNNFHFTLRIKRQSMSFFCFSLEYL